MASYQPLARKYRPATFHELVGQSSTATALANAIKLGREPHAVIFSGVRGIGKTTSARLYAKALNCDKGSSAEPCSQCESCHAIAQGFHEDVMEIDGASNTSVDDVRALRETISYVPQRSRFKVYIIDEVHMLSQSAFNALLKTLEEPPPHVVFIFATTELHKLPQTITSRCQVFFLQRLPMGIIRDRIVDILNQEQLKFEEKAVASIAREGHGSMRDALTLLDHVIAVGNGHVTINALSQIISHISSTPFLDLLDALICRQRARIVNGLNSLEQTGVAMQDVAERIAGLARHAAVARDVGIDNINFKMLGFDDEESRQIQDIGRKAQAFDLNRIFRTLVKCRTELDGSSLDHFVLENYCLEWCLDPGIAWMSGATPQHAPSAKPTNASIAKVPSIPETIIPIPPAPTIVGAKDLSTLRGGLKDALAQQRPSVPLNTISPELTEIPLATKQAPPQFPATWRELVDAWKLLKPLQARKLEEAHPIHYGPDRIELVIPSESYTSASLLRPEEQKKLRDVFSELFAFKGIIVAKMGAPQTSTSTLEEALPETLASVREKERNAQRNQTEEEARSHPITKDAISLFNATITDVTIHDS